MEKIRKLTTLFLFFKNNIMNTIDYILKEANISKEDIVEYRKVWICNWCGWKWGWSISDSLESLPYFQTKKKKNLLSDLKILCCLHDYDYFNKNGFIKSNYKLAIRTLQLLHWTSTWKKICIFILMFWWTTLFWHNYYNK